MNILGIEITPTLLLSTWGAVLSTTLGVIKVLEYRENRFRIEVGRISRSSPEMGHDISIKNISSKPVLLEYMEVLKTVDGEERCVWSPEDGWLNARIEPFDKKVYNFSEIDYFRWEGGAISVQLYFAGRKPIRKFLP